MKHTFCAALALLIGSTACVADPDFSINTFDSGTEGWQPWDTNTANGITPGNPFFEIKADGIGKFGRMITFNWESMWTGNYISTGVTGLQLDLTNRSDSDDLFLRVALGNRASPQQSGGTWWLSKNAIQVDLDTDWDGYFLPIAESEMVVVGNIMGQSDNESFEDTLSDVRNIRILSASVPFGAIGDEFFGDVGIDNVALVPEPTTLPMIGTGLVMIYLYRRKRSEALPNIRTLMRSNPDP